MIADFIQDFGNLMWIIIPLLIIQLSLILIGVWEWNKKKEFLGGKKILWLFIIFIFNFAGPIFFLLYSQRFDVPIKGEESIEDDWEK